MCLLHLASGSYVVSHSKCTVYQHMVHMVSCIKQSVGDTLDNRFGLKIMLPDWIALLEQPAPFPTCPSSKLEALPAVYAHHSSRERTTDCIAQCTPTGIGFLQAWVCADQLHCVQNMMQAVHLLLCRDHGVDGSVGGAPPSPTSMVAGMPSQGMVVMMQSPVTRPSRGSSKRRTSSTATEGSLSHVEYKGFAQ